MILVLPVFVLRIESASMELWFFPGGSEIPMASAPNTAHKSTILVVLIWTTPVFSQVVTFNTSGLTQSGSIAPTFNATQQAPGVAGVPSLSRTGLTFNTGAAGSFFSNGANTTNTLNLANQYVGFQVQPSAGTVLFATSINWASQGTMFAPNNYATAYSTNGFATAIHTTFLGQTSSSAIQRTFNIVDLITSDTLAVRLYNYGATAINGSASHSSGPFRVITPTITGDTLDSATGNITLAAATEIRNSTALTLGGVISGGFSVQKTSNGALTLSADNTYSGGTTVSAGTLVVTNTTGSGTGTGTVTVSGGTFGGTGVVTGTGATVTVQTGGTIEAGNAGIGTLTISNAVTVQNGGTLRSQAGVGAGTSDTINVSGSGGSLTLASGSNLTILGDGTSYSGLPSYTLANLGSNSITFGTYNGGVGDIATYTANGTYSTNGVNVTISGFTFNSGDQLTLRRTPNTLELTFTPVPEPAFVLGAFLLPGGVVAGVRKLLRRAKPAEFTPAV